MRDLFDHGGAELAREQLGAVEPVVVGRRVVPVGVGVEVGPVAGAGSSPLRVGVMFDRAAAIVSGLARSRRGRLAGAASSPPPEAARSAAARSTAAGLRRLGRDGWTAGG